MKTIKGQLTLYPEHKDLTAVALKDILSLSLNNRVPEADIIQLVVKDGIVIILIKCADIQIELCQIAIEYSDIVSSVRWICCQ